MPDAPLPPDLPPEALPFLEEMAYFAPDALEVGSPAPDVPLTDPEGREVRSAALWSELPAVLIFGSYT